MDQILGENSYKTEYTNTTGKETDPATRFLEKDRKQEIQRIENQIQHLNQQIQKREQVHEKNIEELNQHINHNKDLLNKHKKKADGDEQQIRSHLKELYTERRGREAELWNDKEPLLKELRQLRREKAELQDESLETLVDTFLTESF